MVKNIQITKNLLNIYILRRESRQFTDKLRQFTNMYFENISQTELKTVHRQILNCVFVCFVALRQATAVVMAGRSFHLTTLFLGKLEQASYQYSVYILSSLTDNCPSKMIQR